ncbi:MAG: ribosomal protein L7/L12 [Bacteroidales bacterium]|nr:ribosomal protein L7/L12 [Bacteroidales bacterium]
MKHLLKRFLVSVVALLFCSVGFAANSDIISSVTCSGTTFTIKRTTTTYPTTVYYRTVNGSAVGGVHFVAASGEITFKAGEAEKTVTITRLTPANSVVDAYEESNRRFYLEVWNSCTAPIYTGCWYDKTNYVTLYSMYELSVSYAFSSTTNTGTEDHTVSTSSIVNLFDSERKSYLTAVGQSYQFVVRANLKVPGITSGEGFSVGIHPGATGSLSGGYINPQNKGEYIASVKFASTTTSNVYFNFPVSTAYYKSGSNVTNAWNNSSYPNTLIFQDYKYYSDFFTDKNNLVWMIMPSSTSTIGLTVRVAKKLIYTPTLNVRLKDVTGPTVASLNVNSEKIYTSGEKIYVALRFDEIVKVTSTSFSLPLEIAGSKVYFSYEGGSGTNTLYFSASPTISSTNTTGLTLQGTDFPYSYITDLSGNTGASYYHNISCNIGQKYTVTLNKNSGTVNCDEIKYYTYGVGATLPTNVTRTGYTFGGWYTNSSCTGSPVTTISKTDSGNKTYYAKWTANRYLVTLDNRAATSSGTASIYATYGSSMPSITSPIKTGYTFGGYYDGTDGSGTQYYTSSGTSAKTCYLTANTTLYAKWTIKTPTITFNNQSATTAGTTSATATWGSAMPSITKPTKTGYTFGGYFTSNNGGGTQYYLATGASAKICDLEVATTLYAKWTANTYTLTFDNQSATTEGTVNAVATYSSKLPEIIVPTKKGYTFKGYYTSINGAGTKYYNADGSANLTSYTQTSAVTLYAYWTKDTYTITFVNNGGTISESYDNTYQFGEEVTLPAIQRDGCTFGGWFTNANCEGSAVTKIASLEVGNKTYYAKWTPNNYTVTLNLVGGSLSGGNVTTYTYGIGAVLPLSSVMSKSGYGFAGWYEDEDYNGDAVSEITVADFGNKVYWAKWEEGSYPVVLNTNEGVVNSGNVVSYKHGTAKALPTDVTRIGYTFEGWFDNSSCLGTAVTEIPSTAVEVKTFWAKWKEQVYTVTFEENEGTINNEVVISNYTFSVGGTLPTDVTRPGYSFLGWYDNSELLGNAVALIRSSDYGNKTYYAKWCKNTYTIAYNKNGGDIEDEEIVTSYSIGDEFDLPGEVYKEGYSFYGWYDNPNFDNESIEYVEADEYGNKTYYAKWVVNSYSVTLTTNGGTINSGNLSRYTYSYGATLPVDVTRVGYRFDGWYSDASFTSNRITSIGVDEMGSKTFYARWIANTYTITLNVNEGTIKSGNVGSYTYGLTTTLPTNVVRRGYTFGGWYESSNLDGGAVKTISNTSTGNKTYYAKWNVNTYAVDLNADGGTINSGNVSSYVYGVGAILPTNVTKTGYTFDGWEGLSVPSTYRVLLTSCGSAKLNVLKTVRAFENFSWMGLKDAKEFIEAVDIEPQLLEEDITMDEALAYKDAIEEVGGQVAIESMSNEDDATGIFTNISTVQVGDVEFVAVWKLNNYSITYNANGGTYQDKITVSEDGDTTIVPVATMYNYGDTVVLPVPTRVGYTFEGWFNNSNFMGTSVSEINPNEYGDKEFWAKWSEESYKVTLNTNGGEINSGNLVKYTYDALAILPQDVTRTGYTFDGWFDNEECEGTAVIQISKGTVNEQIFYAKWTAKTYTVILQTNNGTVNGENVTSYVYGEGVILPTDVTKEGWVFSGWYSNSSYAGGSVASVGNTETGDKQFWAKWVANEYEVSVEYDSNMGSIVGTGLYEYQSTAKVKAVADDGYEFVEWIVDEANVETVGAASFQTATISFVVKEAINLTAVFKEKEGVYSVESLQIDTLLTETEVLPIDITGLFKTTEGSELTYSVRSSAPNVVSGLVQEGKLYLTTYGYRGKVALTITAKLPNGEKASVSTDVIVEHNCDIQLNKEITMVSCYGESDGKIEVDFVENYTYQWIGFDNTSNVMEGLSAGNYSVVITDERNCQEQYTYTVEQPKEIKVAVSIVNPRCHEEGKIELIPEGEYTYLWENTGSTEKDLIGAPIGDYTVIVTDPSNGCSIKLTPSLELSIKQPEISLVTVSKTTGKNLVVWLRENSDQIEYYTIYRESSEEGEYDSIATVPYSEISVYEDEEADPMERSWSYKISATDSCGNSTNLSEAHSTLHLSQMPSQREGYVELIWEEYKGIDYSSFFILRETTVGSYTFVDTVTTVPASIKSYTAEIPGIGKSTYYVGIKLPEVVDPKQFMKAESGPFSLAMSNIAEAENDEATAVDVISDEDIRVFAVEHTIYVKNSADKEITIMDSMGKILSQTVQTDASIVKYNVRLAGVYFVRIGKESFKVIVK